MSFKFELETIVKIGQSTKGGEVVGRLEYLDEKQDQYLVRYYKDDGIPDYDWFDESDLS